MKSSAKPQSSQFSTTITRYERGQSALRSDALAVEEPLEIQVQVWDDGVWLTHSIAVTMRTPGDDLHLALGFLFTEGVLPTRECLDPQVFLPSETPNSENCNIISIKLRQGAAFDLEKLSRHTFTSSSCGLCGKQTIDAIRATSRPLPVSGRPLPAAILPSLRQKLSEHQRVFQTTGGLHASAIFDEDGHFLELREDVGRHNALDKLIGSMLYEGRLPAQDKVLLLSGRASFELIQKAIFAGFSHVVALGPPSSLAVSLAQEFQMNLVGFLRDESYNLYTGLVL